MQDVYGNDVKVANVLVRESITNDLQTRTEVCGCSRSKSKLEQQLKDAGFKLYGDQWKSSKLTPSHIKIIQVDTTIDSEIGQMLIDYLNSHDSNHLNRKAYYEEDDDEEHFIRYER